MQPIVDFFNQPFFIVLGGIATLLTLLAAGFTVFLIARGILPVWVRLGMGLARRKIAVFADAEFAPLRNMLVDSGLFQAANVVQIDRNAIKKAENMTLFLVHWKSRESDLDAILNVKKDATALVVYAPTSEGRIEPAAVDKINQERNSIVVNFRGRLLNDILVCMITTSYQTTK